MSNFPPVSEGHTRIFTDHTGRWYEDVPNEQLQTETTALGLAIRHELDRAILEKLNAVERDNGI
jgi:hypothetical protein